jgi:hypothetical protein
VVKIHFGFWLIFSEVSVIMVWKLWQRAALIMAARKGAGRERETETETEREREKMPWLAGFLLLHPSGPSLLDGASTLS